eukprot:scaffold7914_cov118-Isochrysis_galbana.AAC.1
MRPQAQRVIDQAWHKINAGVQARRLADCLSERPSAVTATADTPVPSLPVYIPQPHRDARTMSRVANRSLFADSATGSRSFSRRVPCAGED